MDSLKPHTLHCTQENVRAFLEAGPFTALDRKLAAFVEARSAPVQSHWVALAAALASRAIGESDSCLDLASFTAAPVTWHDGRTECVFTPPPREEWARILMASGPVGQEGEFKPLILRENRWLYLHRYREYESKVAETIRRMSETPASPVPFDEPLAEKLDPGLFDPENKGPLQALRTASGRRLCLITGGPGTGKTWTVSRLLAYLLALPGHETLRVALAAPTGKAAFRMIESLRASMQGLQLPESVAARFPRHGHTLHRLLKAIPFSHRFHHNAQNPLPFDLVIVDEASMVDLALFAKFLDALSPAARLILLGDKDQLASVEAGAVMGDLCEAALMRPASQLGTCSVRLSRSRRFPEQSLQARLAASINEGRGDEALSMLMQEGCWRTPESEPRFRKGLLRELDPWIGRYAGSLNEAGQALQILSSVKVLTAIHASPYGKDSINHWLESAFGDRLPPGCVPGTGRPILILENSYETELFNGDTGLLLPDPFPGGGLSGYFQSLDGAPRKIARVRLPRHETAFAVTIHKSQGSEYEEVHVVLPEAWTELLTRELIYTALTRARKRVVFWGPEEVFLKAVAERRRRASGLSGRLAE